MLEFKKKKLDYTGPNVGVLIFRLYGVTYFDLLVGEIMYIVEKELIFYA